MSNVPDGAQVSDDGQWWWDGSAWQPVADAAPSGGGESDRAAARVAQGLPSALTEVTDEQRGKFMGVPTITAAVEVQSEVEVVAMSDAGGNEGEAIA